MKAFLGGTCNGSKWREILVPMLKVDYFDPVVEDWTPECMAEELKQREVCNVCVYVLTPKMSSVYSIAEVVDDSNKRPEKTVFVPLREDGDERFTDQQWKHLGAVAEMIVRNGATVISDLDSLATWLNANVWWEQIG